MDKDIFAKWAEGLTQDLETDHSLTVEFSNDKGVAKTVKVCPQRVGLDFFVARLFEGEYSLGEFRIVILEEAPAEHLGSYELTVIPNETAERHYATHEAPINSEEDFANFVAGFHDAIKKWKEDQQPQKELK